MRSMRVELAGQSLPSCRHPPRVISASCSFRCPFSPPPPPPSPPSPPPPPPLPPPLPPAPPPHPFHLLSLPPPSPKKNAPLISPPPPHFGTPPPSPPPPPPPPPTQFHSMSSFERRRGCRGRWGRIRLTLPAPQSVGITVVTVAGRLCGWGQTISLRADPEHRRVVEEDPHATLVEGWTNRLRRWLRDPW